MATYNPAGLFASFSDAVNLVVDRTGRPNRRVDASAYVNGTIRECQTLKFFDNDMIEDVLTTPNTVTDNWTWTRPRGFRIMAAVKYLTINRWPEYQGPGSNQQNFDYYYYSAQDYYVFANIGPTQDIGVAYYIYLPRLKDYGNTPDNPLTPYPARYDIQQDAWFYWDGSAYVDTLGDPVAEEAARALVSNWILFNHYDMLIEGACNKIWKTVGDQVRTNSSFSLYKSLQDEFSRNELSSYAGP
jgi:hypothetical protein